MNIGGTSNALNGMNTMLNAERDQNRARGQETFVTPEFFSMDLSQHRQVQPGQTLLTFGSTEAKANAEIVRQRMMQETNIPTQLPQQGMQPG